MDNYPIKSVTFGGFDKQDVIRYIEQVSAAQKALQEENDSLRAEADTLRQETASLRAQLEDAAAQQTRLQDELSQECSARLELEKLKPLEAEVSRLKQEADALRPAAEAYAQFRERAADLEAATLEQLQQTVDLFRAQYQVLMSTFETTASHVNSELRKVEVNLTQLPRAMDQSGTELNELAARLERSVKGEN